MTLADFRLIVPPHTPFHVDGSINYPAVEMQAALFVENGINGVFVSGSTGEGQSLSNDERIKIVERWRELTNGTDLRSEEHTSELQSRRNLVCRLLLEKKKYQMHDI